MAITEDFYELLGVPRSASEDEIKKAYRRLARELHPDANPGDAESEARFKQVTVAYETLRDPERRRRYDMFGPEAVRGTGAGETFGFTGGLGDLFDVFFNQGFGAGGARGARNQGADAEIALQITLADAVFGAHRDVNLKAPVPCTTCSGSGARAGTSASTCPDCRGSGQIQRVRQSILGQMVTATPCGRCNGLGQVVTSPCPDCRGEGRKLEDRTLTVEIPAGVDDGATLRIAGAGAAALRGGPSGDLYVHLRVEADDRFERSGTDLITTIHVSVAQAALGTEIELETLDGPFLLAVPTGVQTGRTLKVAGHGVPKLRGGRRGDLLVSVFVDTPTKLSKEEDELLRKLAALRGEQVQPSDPGLFSRLRSALS
ncbi:MAG: molecular chaperone DnaJ [Acidimicrobiales bacterium]|jgi:molecular chaperone DnaJ